MCDNKENITEQSNTPLTTPEKPFTNIPPTPQLKTIGYGTGVQVFRVFRTPRTEKTCSPWVIKRVTKKPNTNDAELNSRVLDEVEILRKLKHPNIVGFRGQGLTEDGRNMLAMENLDTALFLILEERNENEEGPLSSHQIKRVCIDISKALDYLHTEAKMIHGDIKSGNVLIKGDFEICKLCDFGVSLPITDDGYLDKEMKPDAEYIGTSLWSAPEVIHDNDDLIGSKSDIFSFGLTIYECITLTPPHLDAINNTNISQITELSGTDLDESYISEVDNSMLLDETELPDLGTRPPLPVDMELSKDYDVILDIFFMCTNELGEDRPTAGAILNALGNEDN